MKNIKLNNRIQSQISSDHPSCLYPSHSTSHHIEISQPDKYKDFPKILSSLGTSESQAHQQTKPKTKLNSIKFKGQYFAYPNSHQLEIEGQVPFDQAFNYKHSYIQCPICHEWFNIQIPTEHIHQHGIYKKDWKYSIDVYDPIAWQLDNLYFNNHDSYLIQTKTRHIPYYFPGGYIERNVRKNDQRLHLWQLKLAAKGDRTISPIFVKNSKVGIIDIDIYASEQHQIARLIEIYQEAIASTYLKIHCCLSGQKGGDLFLLSNEAIPLQIWTDILDNIVDKLPKYEEVSYEIMPDYKRITTSKKPAMMRHQETGHASAFIDEYGNLIENQQIHFLSLRKNESRFLYHPYFLKPSIPVETKKILRYESQGDDESLKQLRSIIITEENEKHAPSVASSGTSLYQSELIQIEKNGLIEPGTRNYYLWRIAVLHRDVEHLSKDGSIRRLNHWVERHMNGFSKSTLKERLNEVKYTVNYIYDNSDRYKITQEIYLDRLTKEDLEYIKSLKLKEEEAVKLVKSFIRKKRKHGKTFMSDRFWITEREMMKAINIGWYRLKRLLRYLTKQKIIFRTFRGRSSKYKSRRLAAEYILFYNTKIKKDSVSYNSLKASLFLTMCLDEDKQLCDIMMKLSKGNWLYRIEHPDAIEKKNFEWKIRSFKFFNLNEIPKLETLIGSSLLRHLKIDKNTFELLLEVT